MQLDLPVEDFLNLELHLTETRQGIKLNAFANEMVRCWVVEMEEHPLCKIEPTMQASQWRQAPRRRQDALEIWHREIAKPWNLRLLCREKDTSNAPEECYTHSTNDNITSLASNSYIMFELKTLKAPNAEYHFPERSQSSGNRLSVIVGPNGSGKSRVLAALVAQFADRKVKHDAYINQNVATLTRQSQRKPEKVVAQTFSPFSRFPREQSLAKNLEQFVSETNERYSAIGFAKNYGIYGSVSKDAVGRVIRKLYVKPEQGVTLGHVMDGLGFRPTIILGYGRSPTIHNLDFSESDRGRLLLMIEKSLDEVLKRGRVGPEVNKLRRELNVHPQPRLIETIANAIIRIQKLMMAQALRPRESSQYRLEVNLLKPVSEEQREQLGSLVTLTRLGLLRLTECTISRSPRKNLSHGLFSEDTIDMTDASSGEQQLLSSLFSLVAETQDDSLVLIDEPELSLHPAWQTQFLDFLAIVMRPFNGCHVLIATHSPFLAQRAHELKIDLFSLESDSRPLHLDKGERPSLEQTLLTDFNVPVRGSNYVARLILSLVMRGENNPQLKLSAINELIEIKRAYTEASIRDAQIEQLIQDGLDILQSAG